MTKPATINDIIVIKAYLSTLMAALLDVGLFDRLCFVVFFLIVITA